MDLAEVVCAMAWLAPQRFPTNAAPPSVSTRWRLGHADASGDKRRFIAPSDASGGGNGCDAAGCA